MEKKEQPFSGPSGIKKVMDLFGDSEEERSDEKVF
jgi:hypothetical protein